MAMEVTLKWWLVQVPTVWITGIKTGGTSFKLRVNPPMTNHGGVMSRSRVVLAAANTIFMGVMEVRCLWWVVKHKGGMKSKM